MKFSDISISADSVHASSSRTAKLYQVSLLCLIMFLTGSTFSLGIFTLPVEHFYPGRPLAGSWPTGMGLMHFLSAPVLIATGFILDHSKLSLSSLPLRAVSLLSSLAFFLFSLCALGVYLKSCALIVGALAIQAIPLGVYYPLVQELLMEWFPEAPGQAVGLCQLSFGLGSIVVAWVFSFLVNTFGTISAIVIAAALLGTLSFIPSFFLKWPQSEYSHALVESVTHEEGLNLLTNSIGNRNVHLSWNQLVFSMQFAMYLVVVLTAGVSYAFIPYYFKLGSLFHVSHELLLFSFQMTSIASTFFGLVTSVWTDSFLIPSERSDGPFSSGSKNMMGLFLIVQTVFSFLLILISRWRSFTLFVIVVAFLKMIMASHAGCAALVARDIFGPVNSCLTFGIGGGLALGTGEGLSAAIMTLIDTRIGKHLNDMTPEDFDQFYWIAGGWSAIGTLSLVLLRKYRKAFVSQLS